MGWIKLDRKLLNSDIWNRKPFSWGQAWVDLLLLASHDDHTVLIGSELVECKRGDIIRSQAWFAERWGWSRSQVRHFFTTNTLANRATITATNKRTVVHIEKYAFYQGQRPTKEPLSDQPSDQQKDTYKKGRRILKKKVEEDARAKDKKTVIPSAGFITQISEAETDAARPSYHPTINDLTTFCVEEGLNVDIQRFAEYYESRDWKTSTGKPVTDWRLKLRDWDKADREKRIEEETHRAAVEKGREEQAEREAKLEAEFLKELEKKKKSILKAI